MNLYVLLKANLALQLNGAPFWMFAAIFTLVSITFPASFFLGRTISGGIAPFLVWVGAFWLGAIIYFFLIGFAVDLVRFSNYIFSYIPEVFFKHQPIVGRVIFVIIVLTVTAVLFGGHIHTKNVKVRRLELVVNTLSVDSNPLNIVFFSDLHLGKMISKEKLEKVVDLVNREQPDIILIGGDLFDDEVSTLFPLKDTLAKFKAKYGVYGVLGNHEFYIGPDKSTRFMELANIVVLRDDVATIPGVVNILGLDDYTNGRGKRVREGETLRKIIEKGDSDLPTILITHTPVFLENYSAVGIDLALFGHTHNGQFFPFNLVTNAIFKISYGYGRVGDMHAYVSSGVGTWGPPIRVLTDVEIVKITLSSGKK